MYGNDIFLPELAYFSTRNKRKLCLLETGCYHCHRKKWWIRFENHLKTPLPICLSHIIVVLTISIPELILMESKLSSGFGIHHDGELGRALARPKD